MPKSNSAVKRTKKSETVSNNNITKVLESRPTSINFLQIITATAGILGIIVAFMWMFGYSYYKGFLFSIGVQNSLFYLANENLINQGKVVFVSLINTSLIIVVIYTASIFVSAIVFKYLFKKKLITYSLGTILIMYGGLFGLIYSLSFSPDYIFANAFVLPSLISLSIGCENVYQTILVSYQFTFLGIKILTEDKSKIIASIWRIGIIIFLALIVIQINILSATKNGYINGCKVVNERLYTVNIQTTNKVNIGKGYYLAFADRDNYYLYQDINPESLIPVEVIILKKDFIDILSVSYFPHLNTDTVFDDNCKEKFLEYGSVINPFDSLEKLNIFKPKVSTQITITPTVGP